MLTYFRLSRDFIIWLVTRGISPFSYFCRLAIRSARKIISAVDVDIALDLGAGSSPYRSYFYSVFPRSRYLSFDFALAKGLDVVADVTQLPLKNGCVDIVLSFDVIQHLKYPEEMVKEAHRVLRPNGLLILSYPFLYAECDAMDFSRWTRDGFEFLLKENNFRVCEHERRGGIFFLFVTGMIWAIQNITPGRPTSWRTTGPLQLMRSVILNILCFPLMLTSWIALFVDFVLPSSGAYIGCWVVAEKNKL